MKNDYTEKNGSFPYDNTAKEDTASWQQNLEEAIHQQTLKETGDYAADPDAGVSDSNTAPADTAENDHSAADEPEHYYNYGTAASDSSAFDADGAADPYSEDNNKGYYRRSRNFADPNDFVYTKPAPETAAESERRQSDVEKTYQGEAQHHRENSKSPEQEDRRKDNSRHVTDQAPRRKENDRNASGKEEKHVSFSEKMEERQRDHEAADEAVRDSDAVLFDEVVDDDSMTPRKRRKAEKARAKQEKKQEKEMSGWTRGNYDRYDRDDDYGYDDYDRDDAFRHDQTGGTYEPYRDYEDDDSSAAGHSDARRMSRKEQKEYEEFLRYKAQKQKYGKKKKKHRVLKFFIWLFVILLILYCLGTIALRLLGIRRDELNMQDITNAISEEVKESATSGAMAGYRNIALFGVDSIDQSLDAGNNRSDVMIIASINELTGDVKLVSLYRDTYLDIGDGNYQKANAAYAYGGPDQAVSMINTNLDLNVNDYVTVGFGGIADMIDAVGGIEIDVQEDEIEHLNNYQSTMATELGKEYIPVTQTGLQTLNGLQATAYCRIRYTDGGDFKRTERQKEVLSKTFAKLKAAGPLTMIRAARSVSSEMRTSLSSAEIAILAAQAFRFDISETNGFPQEEMRTVGYIGDQSCVIPIHLTDNVVWLHQYLFSDTSYTVSETVQEISDTISAISGY